MDKPKYKRISRETELTEKQVQILKFIARWKFVTRAMISFHFGFGLKYTNEILLKFINQNLVVRIRSSISRGGVHEFIYYITKKALAYLNEDYTYLSSPRRAYHLADHAMSCLKIIKTLGLSENEYLTEMELAFHYKEVKEKLNMTSKPRMCDFAYIDPATKDFVGVEVELHTKDKKNYVGLEFFPNIEKPEDIKFQTKSWVKFGVYNGHGGFDYVKTKSFNLEQVKIDAQKQGLDPETVHQVKKYTILYTDKDGNKDRTAFVNGFSIENAKTLFYDHYGYGKNKIQSVEVKKDRDCIILRHYYALNRKFYNRIDWYLPEGKQHRFIKLFNNFYQEGLPKFYQIHTFDGGEGKKINHELMNYVKKE